MLDTGAHLTEYNSDTLNIEGLVVDPGIKGWNGPYLPFTNGGVRLISGSSNYGDIMIKLGSIDADWGLPTDEATAVCNATCYVWVEFNGVGTPIADYMYEEIDKFFDGSVNSLKGNVRTSVFGSGHIYLAIMPYNN